MNSKGQVTIPAHLRAKYGLHVGDEVEVVEAGGTLQIVRTEGAESRGQRLVRRLRNTATSRDITGASTGIGRELAMQLAPRARVPTGSAGSPIRHTTPYHSRCAGPARGQVKA